MSRQNLEKVRDRRAQVLEAITSTARTDPRIRAALLVGSLASGTDDAYSDIDIVVIPEPGDVDALLAERRTFPARFGDVVLQLDSSWNVWAGASQVLTLLDGDLPLWVDMDIWPPFLPGIPRESRVIAGAAPPALDMGLSDLSTMLRERHGPGRVEEGDVDGVMDVAWLTWRLKGIARGYGKSLHDVRRALDQPWPAELERAREPIRRYADHVQNVANR